MNLSLNVRLHSLDEECALSLLAKVNSSAIGLRFMVAEAWTEGIDEMSLPFCAKSRKRRRTSSKREELRDHKILFAKNISIDI